MAEQGIIYQRKLWMGAYEIPYIQSLRVATDIEGQDDTIFGDTGRSEAPGLEVPVLEAAGLFGAGAATEPDQILASYLTTNDVPVSVGAVASADGDPAYFFRARTASYSPGGAVGEMLRYDVSARGRGHPLIPGTILTSKSVSATENSTSVQVGSVAATRKVYAVLHVTAVSGDRTLTATIRSFQLSDKSGAVIRISFTAPVSAIGYEYAIPVSGTINDTWWDTRWIIGGTTGSITATVLMGIR